MKNPTIKLTTHDVYDSIWLNNLYPNLNTSEQTTCWISSQDIQAERSLMCLIQEEKFVECVATSKKPPFKFSKSMTGSTLIDKKPSHHGKLYYDLLRIQHGNSINSAQICPDIFRTRNCSNNQEKYEESEYSKILHAVAGKLNLNQAYFFYDPMSRIGIQGIYEGELINNLATHLQAAIKRPSFQSKLNARKDESSKNFTVSKRYIARLHKNSPYLYGVRMTLCYSGNKTKPISLKKSDDHLKTFVKIFKTTTSLDSPVGWWCKREYTTETGYCYNLIIFFDRQKTPYNPMVRHDIYAPLWHSATEGQGAYFIPPVPEKDYMGLKTGFLCQGNDDSFESLLLTMQCMVMCDNILRLKRSADYPHIVMGTMPKLENITIPTSYAFPKSSGYVLPPAQSNLPY